MAVNIISTLFKGSISNSTGLSLPNWPLFCIGELIQVQCTFEVYTEITFTSPAPLVTGNTSNVNMLYNASGKFSSLSVGDTIRIVDASGFFATSSNQKFNVLQKFSNNQILVSNAIVSGSPIPTSLTTSTAVIYNLTLITGIEVNYNFIENSEANNYISKVDGSLMSLKATNVDTSNIASTRDLVPQGTKDWQTDVPNDSAIWLVSYDATTGRQRFTYYQEVVVTPLFLASQFSDLSNNIAPEYYLAGKCLKYVNKITVYSNILNPNTIQIGESNPALLGQSGWFNEMYNGGPQTYFIENTVFKNGTTVIPKLFFPGGGQSIEFDITSPNGDFLINQRLSVALMKLPNSEAEYQNKDRLLTTNFLWVNRRLIANNIWYSPLSVETFMYRAKAVFVDVNTIHVTVELIFTPDVIAILSESTIPRFMFWATISSGSLTDTAVQNKQAIWDKKAYEFATNIRPGDYSIRQVFKRHYEDAADDGITGAVSTFKNDECVIESFLSADWHESPPSGNSDTTYPKNVKCQIIAKRKLDGAEFILEDWNLDLVFQWAFNSYGYQPIINYSSNRIFKIPTDEIRKPITITNVYPTPSNNEIKISYPFMMRWEYWEALMGVNSDFYNPSEPNNGFNQDWEHYITSYWSIYFRTGVTLITGVGTYYDQKDLLMGINDYATNSAYTTKKVESFRLNGTQLISGSDNFIMATENTLIKATFGKGVALNKDNCIVVFGIEIKEQGGINGRVRFSSIWETETPLTWFIPFSGTAKKVNISQLTTNSIDARAILDYTLLPQGNIEYTIVARLYEVPSPIDTSSYKKMSDGTFKLMSNGTQKIMA